MKERVRKLVDKALDTIEVAEALLYEKGLEFSTHGRVIAADGKVFAKTKALDPKFHQWLRAGFDARISGSRAGVFGRAKDLIYLRDSLRTVSVFRHRL